MAGERILDNAKRRTVTKNSASSLGKRCLQLQVVHSGACECDLDRARKNFSESLLQDPLHDLQLRKRLSLMLRIQSCTWCDLWRYFRPPAAAWGNMGLDVIWHGVSSASMAARLCRTFSRRAGPIKHCFDASNQPGLQECVARSRVADLKTSVLL